MKRKWTNCLSSVLVFLICLVVGMTVPIEFGQRKEEVNYVSLSSVARIEEEQRDVEKEIEEYKLLVESKREELDKWSKTESLEDKIGVLKEDIQKYKILAGAETLRGPGIRIRIGDSLIQSVTNDRIENELIHDMDVLNIINDLKAAGAEAISINGERLVDFTGIQCGGPVVLVNHESVTAPFVISVIGDPEQLYAAINAPNTYGYVLKNIWKLDVETIISDNVYVPKVRKTLNIKYAKTVEEGE